MNEELNKRLNRILKHSRPRPLMFIGRHNGKKCYVRKQDLSQFQFKEEHPKKKPWFDIMKSKHRFMKQHILTPLHLKRRFSVLFSPAKKTDEDMWCVWCAIIFIASAAILHAINTLF